MTVDKMSGSGWEIKVFSTAKQQSIKLPLAKRMCKKAKINLDGCNTARVWPWEDENEREINISRDLSEALKDVVIQGNRGKSISLPGVHHDLLGRNVGVQCYTSNFMAEVR